MRILFTVVCILLSISTWADESTSFHQIDRIQINATGTVPGYYFFKDGGWGPAGCPGAVYAYLTESDSGAKAILSIGLAAKSSGAEVAFSGNCDSGGKYFKTNYIYLK